jgi:hypothetical protein
MRQDMIVYCLCFPFLLIIVYLNSEGLGEVLTKNFVLQNHSNYVPYRKCNCQYLIF